MSSTFNDNLYVNWYLLSFIETLKKPFIHSILDVPAITKIK